MPVLGNLAPLAAAGKIEFERMEERGIRVFADRFRFKQVLYNLLSNAIKFSPPGKNILVETRVQGGFALVAVQDYGPGISPEDHQVIFEEFRQVGYPLADLGEGSRARTRHHQKARRTAVGRNYYFAKPAGRGKSVHLLRSPGS